MSLVICTFCTVHIVYGKVTHILRIGHTHFFRVIKFLSLNQLFFPPFYFIFLPFSSVFHIFFHFFLNCLASFSHIYWLWRKLSKTTLLWAVYGSFSTLFSDLIPTHVVLTTMCKSREDVQLKRYISVWTLKDKQMNPVSFCPIKFNENREY